MDKETGLLVIWLIDSFTSGPPQGAGVSVTVDGLLQQPLRKANGMFVFQRVPPGTYRVRVQAGIYFSEVLDVSTECLDPMHPVVPVSLLPTPAYPFDYDATLVRAALRDEADRPLAGVEVTAVVADEASVKARLAKAVAAGERELALVRQMSRIRAGESYLLRGSKVGKEELCTIYESDEPARTCLCVETLGKGFEKGSLLLPTMRGRSDDRGELVLPFRNVHKKIFVAELRFVTVGGIDSRKEVSVGEGRWTALGAVRL